ncbi:UDP-N-acetylmuramoylalanine--D-glutamate ligase [hydrothermal vent metagenome]|uniref:UDP-N-acetylmuramoylalanine--D-glutamate ligase n=1 Tax=hydrothermal vent metagenome TaxID=652676 RepID=A0A3B1AS24_9ZZZZ
MVDHSPQTEAESGRTLIVGLGLTGISCARYLSARNIPAVIIDSRARPPGLSILREQMFGVSLVTGGFDPLVFISADRIVVSPGVAVDEPQILAARKRGVEIIGDIELFAREVAAPVVAVTGSNGKSTVTTLLGEMARKAGRQVAVGGNLGPPALDLLADEVDLYALELSSFQLETTSSLRPKVAVVLNLSPDHLDRYAGFAEYAATKMSIYADAEIRLYNRDDTGLLALRESRQSDIYFTLQEPGPDEFGLRLQDGGEWFCHGLKALLPIAQMSLPGRHNLANALAALALGHAMELPMPAMLEALRTFSGLPHRSQFVAEKNRVRWYNDSKATNVGACVAALQGMATKTGGIVLIAGGESKDADFAELTAAVVGRVRTVVLIGRDAALLEDALSGVIPVVHAPDMTDAVAQAHALAEPGDLVLLSPACASHDMFRSFAHRGEVFMDSVKRLLA